MIEQLIEQMKVWYTNSQANIDRYSQEINTTEIAMYREQGASEMLVLVMDKIKELHHGQATPNDIQEGTGDVGNAEAGGGVDGSDSGSK